ncbi:HCN2 [Symbiodinium pilosum]|uniref:HCN2 protein n=1 Tax=Symbiodinium pilosum TaxID=2952 RepID=A0A812WJM8_SYMPI|nr:HCN2 [Symbiodinium pilosum]
MDVGNRVRSESGEGSSGKVRAGSKGTMTSLHQVVEVLQELSHRYDQEVQELRATVAKLTSENRKLMRRTSDSDGSTSATNTWTSSGPSSSIQDSFSPNPISKITSYIAEEPDRPESEDDRVLDPFLDVEVLEEITPVEYEARRRAANSEEALQQDNSFQRHASYAAFKLKDLWTSEVLSKARTPRAATVPPPSTTSTALRLRPTVAVNAAAMGMAELYQGWVSRFIARPGDRKRLLWDCCGLLFIVYDCIAIPINVFDPPVSTFTIFMDWLTLVFWTLNIGATLTTGFVREGLEVLSPKEIMKNYLRTWFIIDVLTLGPDWTLEIIAGTAAASDSGEGWSDSAGSQSVRLLRVLRFVRIARLLRLLKLKLLLEAIGDALPMSDYATIVARVAQMVAVLLYLNHVIACIFFATAALVSDQNTWVGEYGLTSRPWTDQYAVALHWSLTQFTPASMNVQPQNSVERCFAISVVIFALVGFSYVVGDISSCLTQLRNMSETSSKEFRKLRNFMRMHKVPRLLALRVTKFAEHAYSKQREAMPMSKVTLLHLISEQLLGELTFAMNKPHLVVHPLFETMELNATLFLQRMCIKALAPKQLAHNDFLFVSGEQAKEMTFLTSGMLLYKRVFGAKEQEEYVQIDCDWITEQALWLTHWEHLGTAESLGESTLVSIDSEAFATVVEQSSTALVRLVQLYARQFIGWLNELQLHQLSDMVQGDVLGEKVRSFIPENLARATS